MKHISNLKFDIVFLLFCTSNVLNIFMDRGSTGFTEDTGASRILIQLINIGALGLMLTSVFIQKCPNSFKWVKCLIALLMIYFISYMYFPLGKVYTINHYFKFLTNLVGFYFFYVAYLKMQPSRLRYYVQIYVITLIAASGAKIFSTSAFSLEGLGAGDTASIALVFLIPLIFIFFELRYATILYLIAFGLAVVSLRRTCIIAFVISIPFLISYLKTNIRFFHVIITSAIFTITAVYLWDYFGNSLIIRFSEITTGNGDSYGSGRSTFYSILVDNFFEDSDSYLFGHGLNSVWAFYRSKYLYYLPHAHNDFLELLYTFGFIGLMFWVLFLVTLSTEKWPKRHGAMERRLFYMSICLYLVVALVSGALLRIETLPFVMSISFLLASKYKLQNEDILLLSRAKHANVLVAENSIL